MKSFLKGEHTMIYSQPQIVTPFSITNVREEGFTRTGNYRVLMVERNHDGLFFIVADDKHELRWVSHRQCHIV